MSAMCPRVPQGNVLVPMLFIICMNELPFHMYASPNANDSTLSARDKTDEDLQHKLSPDIKAVDE